MGQAHAFSATRAPSGRLAGQAGARPRVRPPSQQTCACVDAVGGVAKSSSSLSGPTSELRRLRCARGRRRSHRPAPGRSDRLLGSVSVATDVRVLPWAQNGDPRWRVWQCTAVRRWGVIGCSVESTRIRQGLVCSRGQNQKGGGSVALNSPYQGFGSTQLLSNVDFYRLPFGWRTSC
jgi:hypothetical protein